MPRLAVPPSMPLLRYGSRTPGIIHQPSASGPRSPPPWPPLLLRYGSRTPGADKVREVLVRQPAASATTVDDACRWADAIILATPGRLVTCPRWHAR